MTFVMTATNYQNYQHLQSGAGVNLKQLLLKNIPNSRLHVACKNLTFQYFFFFSVFITKTEKPYPLGPHIAIC